MLSRAAAGLPARPSSLARLSGSSGLTVHYNGPAMFLTGASLAANLASVRSIWRFHTGPSRGWLDIGYNFLVCADGTVVEGRGWGWRPAAQGSLGNRSKHAVMVLIGGDERPTDEQLAALVALDAEHRRRYGRSKLVPHHRWMARTCPGPHLTRWLKDGAPAPRPPAPPAVDTEGDDMPSRWAKDAWDKVTARGLLDGRRPKEPLTREELAVVLDRTGLLDVDPERLRFLDGTVRQLGRLDPETNANWARVLIADIRARRKG